MGTILTTTDMSIEFPDRTILNATLIMETDHGKEKCVDRRNNRIAPSYGYDACGILYYLSLVNSITTFVDIPQTH